MPSGEMEWGEGSSVVSGSPTNGLLRVLCFWWFCHAFSLSLAFILHSHLNNEMCVIMIEEAGLWFLRQCVANVGIRLNITVFEYRTEICNQPFSEKVLIFFIKYYFYKFICKFFTTICRKKKLTWRSKMSNNLVSV